MVVRAGSARSWRSLLVVASNSPQPDRGTRPGSLLFRGPSMSYGVPLVVIALSLVGHAIYQRSAVLALAAGRWCLVQPQLTCWLLAWVAAGRRGMDAGGAQWHLFRGGLLWMDPARSGESVAQKTERSTGTQFILSVGLS
jgi:hypothetical protein